MVCFLEQWGTCAQKSGRRILAQTRRATGLLLGLSQRCKTAALRAAWCLGLTRGGCGVCDVLQNWGLRTAWKVPR